MKISVSLLVLALPIFLTLLMRRASLKRHREGASGAWFGYWRFLQWNSLGSLILWLTVFELLRLSLTFKAAFDSAFNGQATALRTLSVAAITFLPPLFINVLCTVLSHPVFVQVQGTNWTRYEILRQAVWSQMATIVPLVLFLEGFLGILPFQPALGAATVLTALFVWFFSARRLQRATGSEPQALTSGELRDRAFALAERAGAKLRQLYLLPARRALMANACARRGNSILVTDYLLAHLGKREVDAVLAHEVAHLKRRHPGLLLLVLIIATVGTGILAAIADPESHGLPAGSLFPFAFLAGLVLFLMVSRRFERTADGVAAELTGDAESLIRALSKLAAVNRFPMQWGKLQDFTLSHPSTLRRVQAIARRAGISDDRLSQLLNSRGDNEEEKERYCLPPSAAPEGKVFSTVRKTNMNLRMASSLIAASTLPPALAAFLAIRTDRLAVSGSILVLGLLVAVLLALWITNVGVMWGVFALKRKILERMESRGLTPCKLGGVFVGLSPDRFPRIYETNYSWDLGFLLLIGDSLCYLGEETRFALRRDQIVDIHLGPGFPSWWPTRRIYVSWKDESSGSARTVNLGPADSGSARKLYRDTAALGKELQHWFRDTSMTVFALPDFELPGSPALGAVTSQSPCQFGTARRYVSDAVLMVVISVLVASLFGLWDSFAALGVLYTTFVAVLVFAGLRVPYSLYRDRVAPGHSQAESE